MNREKLVERRPAPRGWTATLGSPFSDAKRQQIEQDGLRAAHAIETISGKHQPAILIALADDGPLRGVEVLERIETDYYKILRQSIDPMVEQGLVLRAELHASCVGYEITPAGEEMVDIFDMLVEAVS